MINDIDTLELMLHTAANEVSLIEAAVSECKSINWNSTEASKSWGGNSSSRRSLNNSLKIGNIERDSLDIWESKNSGPNTDGKFGLNFFGKKIIEINYDQSILVLHPSLPKNLSDYEKVKTNAQHGMLFIACDIEVNDTSYNHQYLMHSGFSGAILFDDEFAAQSNLSQVLEIIDSKELRDSYDNVLKMNTSILPMLKIGSQKFQNLEVGFFEGKIGRQRMSVFGGGLLKQFNLLLELENGNLYIQANQNTIN